MLKKKIVGILLVGLLVGTIFAGCVEKEVVKPEEIRIKPEEIIKGIEGASIKIIDETDAYAICDVEFVGEKDAKIKGTLLIPFEPNGAGTISYCGMGAPRDVVSADRFARAGYVALACDNRGHGESGGYFNEKYVMLDAITEVDILDSALENLNEKYNLPGNGNIGVCGSTSTGSRNALHTAAFDPKIKAVVTLGSIVNVVDGIILPALESPLSFPIEYLEMSARLDIDLARETHILPLSLRTPMAAIGFLIYLLQDMTYPSDKFVPSIEVPTLCIYGENDVTSPPKGSKRVFDQIGSQEKELLVIPDVDNTFMTPEGESKADEVMGATVEWMNNYLIKEGI
jgi:pimeloyl-ACP methyl ester carboxylesterase